MNTDPDAERGQPPRLTPPPRVTPPPRAQPTPEGGGGNVARWLTLALFSLLAVAAIAVFVVLPEWVDDRRQTELVAASVDDVPSPEVEAESAAPAEPADGESGELEVDRDDIEPPPPPAPATSPPATRRSATPRARIPEAPPATTNASEKAFARAMSDGLAALDRQDWAGARKAFSRAAALQPGAPQSADGLARAEAGARLAAIGKLHREAEDLTSREDWHAASERYQAILEIDPAVELAIDGLARSQRRAELADRLQEHLAKPQRLASDEVLEEAAAVLELTSAVEAPGPELARRTEQLARLVDAFSTPVKATLESDQLTEVVVYKVGRLGTFDRHSLDLRPGTYTVVGSRRGYRDVRRQLVIEPGVAPEPLAIRCEERI